MSKQQMIVVSAGNDEPAGEERRRRHRVLPLHLRDNLTLAGRSFTAPR